jgi:membrane protein YqaA with SNARE-associated domain
VSPPSQESADAKGAPGEAPAGEAPLPPGKAPVFNARRAVLRIAASLAGFFLFMTALAWLLGPQINSLSSGFIERFGLPGLALGTFMADAFSLPPPPLFYVIVVGTGSGSHLVGMTVVSLASVVAGNVGYRLSALVSARPFFKRRIDATRARMDVLFERYGVWAFAIASLTPLPFSLMCYVAGVYRIRPWLFALVCLFRIPRLLVMYWMVRAGWVTGGG